MNKQFSQFLKPPRAFVKEVRVFRGYADGRMYIPDTHQVSIEYKFNNLTNLKLTNKIDVGYKKNGHRTGEISHEITIGQHFFSANSDTNVKIGVVGYVDIDKA